MCYLDKTRFGASGHTVTRWVTQALNVAYYPVGVENPRGIKGKKRNENYVFLKKSGTVCYCKIFCFELGQATFREFQRSDWSVCDTRRSYANSANFEWKICRTRVTFVIQIPLELLSRIFKNQSRANLFPTRRLSKDHLQSASCLSKTCFSAPSSTHLPQSSFFREISIDLDSFVQAILNQFQLCELKIFSSPKRGLPVEGPEVTDIIQSSTDLLLSNKRDKDKLLVVRLSSYNLCHRC